MRTPKIILVSFFLSSQLFGDISPLMMLPIGEKKLKSADSPLEDLSSYDYQQQERRATEDNSSSSLIANGRLSEEAEETTTQQEPTHPLASSTINLQDSVSPPLYLSAAQRFFLQKTARADLLHSLTSAHRAARAAVRSYLQGNHLSWESLTQKKRDAYNQSLLTLLTQPFSPNEASGMVRPPLSVMETLLLDQQHQTLLTAANLKNDAAEKAEELLINNHANFNEKKKELTAFQEPIEIAVTSAEEALSAWFSLASFAGDYIALAPSRRITLSRKTLLPTVQDAVRSWQVRLFHYEMFQAEYESSLLLEKIKQLKKEKINENSYRTAMSLLNQKKVKTTKINEQSACLINLYEEGYHKAPIDKQGWWRSRLERLSSRDAFGKVDLLKSQALQREFMANMSKLIFFKFLNNERINIGTNSDTDSAMGFLNQVKSKIEKEKETWFELEQAYIEIKRNSPEKITDELEEDFKIAKLKQFILSIQQEECKARQKNILAEHAYYVALERLRTQHSQDPIQTAERMRAEEAGRTSQDAWNAFNQFSQEPVDWWPIQIKDEWNSLISMLEEERTVAQWRYFNFKKEAAITSAELYEKRMQNSVDASTFYTTLIGHGKEVIAQQEMLLGVCRERSATLLKYTAENSTYSTSREWWQNQYNEISEQKDTWLLDVNKWEIKQDKLRNPPAKKPLLFKFPFAF